MIKIILPVLVLLIVLWTSLHQQKPKVAANGFSVIELFTSEGCSSCPPADALIAEVKKDYADKNVLVLSYHVDYWDRLGWKDRFSNHQNTERQNYYASLFHLSSIYTPQAVINGQKEIVGSNKKELLSFINNNKEQKKEFEIKTKVENGNQISVSVNQNIDPKEKVLVFLIQQEASTKVGGGENGGRELHHVNIVRGFRTLSEKEKVYFTLPQNNPEEFSIAAISQQTDGKITGFTINPINK